jgi:SAM-dependent methyltransferase
VDATDIRLTTAVEDRHWWYRERRAILVRQAQRLGAPGRAIEIGAAGGGNAQALRRHGWDVLATEYLSAGVEIAHGRGLTAVRADACALPVETGSFDLLVAFDVLEHIEDDARAALEIRRVLRSAGTALIAVPADMRLWSAHDVISGHHRRYTRRSLATLLTGAGLRIVEMWSWNVLMRPVLALTRARLGSAPPADPDAKASLLRDVTDVHPLLNTALGAFVRMERWLPLGSLPGVTLMVRATCP